MNSDYYDEGGISLLNIWKTKLTVEEFRGLCKGNILKYITRAGKKKGQKAIDDYKKAKNYLDFLIETYKEEK